MFDDKKFSVGKYANENRAIASIQNYKKRITE